METVNAFNIELCSLYSTKPPISKTKMVELTKLAMKAAKFYKHVVQSIEKFINKCQPEFKIPGLYVIDSIVRQSRHQFGADKDVFSQRFSKNIAMTFHNLLTCPAQDICKIIRVLNLWQKNSVFSPTIIQPLLDMAADPLNIAVYLTAQKSIQRATGMMPSMPQSAVNAASTSRANVRSSSGSVMDSDVGSADSQNDVLKAISQLLQQQQQQQQQTPPPIVPLLNPQQLQLHLIQQQLMQQIQVQQQPEPALSIDSNLMAQIQALTAALMSRLGGGSGGGGGGPGIGEGSVASEELVGVMETSPIMNKKFMDVSYTESDLDDDRRDVHSCSSLSLISALATENAHSKRNKNKITELQLGDLGHPSKLWSPEEADASRTFDRDVDRSHDDVSDVATPMSCQPRPPTVGSEDCFVSPFASSLQQLQSTPCEDELPLTQKVDRRDHFERALNRNDAWKECYGKTDEWSTLNLKQPIAEHQIRKRSAERLDSFGREHGHDEMVGKDQSSARSNRKGRNFEQDPSDVKDSRRLKAFAKDQSFSKDNYRSGNIETERKPSRRSRSRSRSPSRNSHRSRSKSHSRTVSSEKKHRSRSPDCNRSWKRVECEKPVSNWLSNERQRSLMVPLKEQHASIVSLTIWIGNVGKQVKEELLRTEAMRFGKASINFLPQRGCAFACFETRQEASEAVEGLNNLKLMEKPLKVTWAPNIGIKESEFKSRWDVDLGVTYIPWDRLPPDLDSIAVGAVVDEASLPEQLRNRSDSAALYQDDQMTSNEVTSSTDCQQDGQATTPSAVTLPGNSLSSVEPGSLVRAAAAAAATAEEKSKESIASLPTEASDTLPGSVPEATDKDACLSESAESKVSQELPLLPELSLTCSQLVQGIQNILNSANASNVSSSQSVPGIIAPKGPTPASSADVFPPLSGIWPSICGFNPHVPPPNFLPNFDPTRPPPLFGQPAVADESASLSEKKQEENSSGVVEDTSENMDLDDSGSSSQGDDQDFLESRIELVQPGPVSSGLQFVVSQTKDATTSSWSSTCEKNPPSTSSNWNSNITMSSAVVSSSGSTSFSSAGSVNSLMPSISNAADINCFSKNDGTGFVPPLNRAFAPGDNSQNSSHLSNKPASVSVIPGSIFDWANGTAVPTGGFEGSNSSELALQPNLGNFTNLRPRDPTVPVRPCADKPDQCISVAPSIPFQGQGVLSHNLPGTMNNSGNLECMPFDKKKQVMGTSMGMFVGPTPHSLSDARTEVHDISRGASAQLSDVKPGANPFDFGISGGPKPGFTEISVAKNVPLGFPGNHNQMPCPSSSGMSVAPNQLPHMILGNNSASSSSCPGRSDHSQQVPDGAERSVRRFCGPGDQPQMADVGHNVPCRMPGNPNGSPQVPRGQMQMMGDAIGLNRIPLGPEVRPFLGTDGPNPVPGSLIRMPFGANVPVMPVNGQNQISSGPHTLQERSFGCLGPGHLSDVKERGFSRMMDVSGCPVNLPGMPVGPVPIRMLGGLDIMRARPPQIDGPNQVPNMPGMLRGPVQMSAQMPRMCNRGMDVAIGANRMPVPNQIPGSSQPPGSHGMPGPNQMTGSSQLPGQGQPGSAADPLGNSLALSLDKDGLRAGKPPFLGMFPPGAVMGPPGPGGLNVGSAGALPGPSGSSVQFPLGAVRMSSNSGGPSQQIGLPFGPERMPSFDGMLRELKGDMSKSCEGISQFGMISPGQVNMHSNSGAGPPAPGLGMMLGGNSERLFNLAGMNRGSSGAPPMEGVHPSNAAPMTLIRPGLNLSNVPDSPSVGLSRPPFGPLMMSSSSFGGRGAPCGPGPTMPNPMESLEQINSNREQHFNSNWNTEMGLKHTLSGPTNLDFPQRGFVGNQSGGNSDGHSFSSRIGSGGFDQHANASQNTCGTMENTDKLPMGNQQCLPSSICSGIGFQGLLGLGNNSIGGKPLAEQVGLFGLDNKRTAIPSLFSNLDNINIVPGHQSFVAKDQFFLKPQLEGLQQNEGRRWPDDDDDDGRTTGRHIRRSDLFPSLKQRGRHQHGSHRWHDRRHDRRDYSSREFKDRSDRQDFSRRSNSRDNHTSSRSKHAFGLNAPSKDNQMPENKSEIKFDTKSEIKSEFKSGLKSEFKPDMKSEIVDQKTVAETGNRCAEIRQESAGSAVSEGEKDNL